MDINWSIVGWIAGLLFVYLFGLFEGRGQGYKRRKAEEEKELKENPPPPPPAAPAAINADDPGLLRIKNENGSLTLDLDGSRVNATALSPDQRKRLIEMLTMIRPWLDGRAAPAAAPSMTAPPAPARAATPPPPATPPIQPAAPKPATIAKEDRPSTPANSIVAQIDMILQTRIAGTSMEERGVFLAQSPEGGVMVYVGLTKYMGVDEVPDEQIKSAIRAAIAEWEKKYTPGL